MILAFSRSRLLVSSLCLPPPSFSPTRTPILSRSLLCHRLDIRSPAHVIGPAKATRLPCSSIGPGAFKRRPVRSQDCGLAPFHVPPPLADTILSSFCGRAYPLPTPPRALTCSHTCAHEHAPSLSFALSLTRSPTLRRSPRLSLSRASLFYNVKNVFFYGRNFIFLLRVFTLIYSFGVRISVLPEFLCFIKITHLPNHFVNIDILYFIFSLPIFAISSFFHRT
jgi:hypothetical protein